MADYKEEAITGKKWQRAKEILITNRRDEAPTIIFTEEELIDLGDGTIISNHVQEVLQAIFTEDNKDTPFHMINPATNEELASTMTYQEFYTAVYSLYFHLAAARDV